MQKSGAVEMDRIVKTDRGFTLIEVLIAMLILTVGIMAMMTMQVKAVTTNYRASAMTVASAGVASQLEVFQMLDYLDPTLSSGSHPSAATPVFAPGTDYPVTWVVTDNAPVAGNKRISVTVQVPNDGPTVTYEYIKHRNL